MLSFITRVESHAIFDLLSNSIEQAKKIRNIENLDESASENIDRIIYVLDQVHSALKNFDQALLPIATLNNAVSLIQNVYNCLSNYYGNRNISFLTDANTYIDSLLQHFFLVLYPKTSEEVEGFRESITSFKRSVAQHSRYAEEEHRKLVNENELLRQKVNELASQINSEKQRVDTVIGQVQQQINAFQQQFSQAEEKRRDTFSQVMENWKDNFNEETAKRFTGFNEIIVQLTKRKEEFEQKLTEKNDVLQQSFKSKADDILETLKGHKREVEELVGVITNSGLAGGYQKVANEEKDAMVLWRWIAVGGMLVLIGFAGYILYESFTKQFSVTMLIAKIFGALSVGTLVAYAARQASIHGRSERSNRRMELELKAIGPYLVGFEKNEELQIKRSLVEKFFGKEEVASKEEPSSGSTDVIKLALETVQQVSKKL